MSTKYYGSHRLVIHLLLFIYLENSSQVVRSHWIADSTSLISVNIVDDMCLTHLSDIKRDKRESSTSIATKLPMSHILMIEA